MKYTDPAASTMVDTGTKKWYQTKACACICLFVTVVLTIGASAGAGVGASVLYIKFNIRSSNEKLHNCSLAIELEGNLAILSNQIDYLEGLVLSELIPDSDLTPTANTTGISVDDTLLGIQVQANKDDVQEVKNSLQELITSTNTSIQLLKAQTYRNISELENSSQEVNESLHELIDFTNTAIQRLKADQMKLAMESYENISRLNSFVGDIEGGLMNLVQDTHVNLTEALANANTRLTSLKENVTQLAMDSYDNISAIVEHFEGRITELNTRIIDHTGDPHTLDEESISQDIQDIQGRVDILDRRLNEVMKQLQNDGAEPFRSVHWSVVLGLTVGCALVMHKY